MRSRVESQGMSGWSHSSQASGRPVRRQAGSGEEVRALDEDARRAFAVERHLDDRRDRLALARVVLAHGQEPATAGVEPQVGVAVGALGRDRLGLGDAGVQPVQPPVGPVREDDRAAGDGVRPAAVLVDAGPDVERRRASGPRSCRRRRAARGRCGRPRRAGPRSSRSRRRRSTARRAGRSRRAGRRCGSATASCRTAGDGRLGAARRALPAAGRSGSGRSRRPSAEPYRVAVDRGDRRSGPVLPGRDVVGLLGGHRLELDAERRELEPRDLGVDRLGDDVDLRLELGVVLRDVLGATAPGSRSSCP